MTSRGNGAELPRAKVLVVLPYGMCFRNILMNQALWGYLTANYQVEILTDLEVARQEALGIKTTHRLSGKGLLARIANKVNNAAIHCLTLLDTSAYFLRADLGGTYAGIYRVLGTPSKRGRLLLFGAVREYQGLWPFSWVVAVLNRFPILHPDGRLLQRGKYQFVMLGHNSENHCIITGRLANRLGIPVICPLMGVDNLMHGALQFVPDLMLLWGQQQAEEFQTFQLPLKPQLQAAKCEIIGSLAYDNYVHAKDDRDSFLKEYCVADDQEVVLFAAYPDHLLAGQHMLCELIAKLLMEHEIRAKLLVRLRTGSDEAVWREFQRSHPDLVALQIPRGASYDKSNEVTRFDPDDACRDMELFANTVRNSSLLILPSLSTMYLDALAFNVPSVVAMFNYENESGLMPHRDMKPYLDYVAMNPAFKEMRIVSSKAELSAFLQRFFVDRDRSDLLSMNYFQSQTASSNDGRSGERAVRAIQEFLATKNQQPA